MKRLYQFGIYDPLLKKEDRERLETMVKAKVEKAVTIADGKHTGKIKELIEKEKPYHYVDIVISVDELDIDLKCGVPVHITENSALGKILTNFGASLEEGKEVEVENFLKDGTEVEFTTVTEETKKGSFARIQPMTLKPK